MKEKFCTKCGNKLEDIDKFCGKCGEPVPGAQTQVVDGNVQQVIVQPVNPRNLPISPEDNKTANILSLVTLAMYLFGPVTTYILELIGIKIHPMLESLSWTLTLFAIGLLIYIRIKYPKNVFSKVIAIILIIMCFLAGIFLAFIFITLLLLCGGYGN